MSVPQAFMSQVRAETESAFDKIKIIIWQQRFKNPNLQFIDDQVEHWTSLLLFDGETFPGGESISGKAPPAPPFTITMPRDPNTPEYVERISDIYYDLLFRNDLDLTALDNRKAFLKAIDNRTEELVIWLKGMKDFMVQDPRAYDISTHDQEVKESYEPYAKEGIIESVNSILGPLERAFCSEKDYKRAVRVLVSYFNGRDIHENDKIHTRGSVKGKIAFALGEIHRDCLNAHPTHRYLLLLTKAFKIFEKEDLDKDKSYDTRLYKYCSTKPHK